ncbi:sensor histidine kinase [Pelovirga terrestris]|uniref:histidine kinase n=1 Tax=Pelovirga terrestris TaxID=2771352 RepID=A0A8J6UIW4_9BACT|nr:ATP-binding protein [Pelovirga terrestris]MBD1401835.1 GHKL domain-containing protein [Pelovirga terrestris]
MINLSTMTDHLDFIAARLDGSTQVALVTLTADTRIIDYTQAFKNLIERDDNLKDANLKNLLLAESRALLDDNPVEKSPLQLNFTLADHNSLALQCSFHPTRDGYLMYGEQAILADSDVMRTISLLNNELAGLTRELNRRNRVLKQTQGQLQRKNDEIKQYASIIAHDFNSPLITINAFVGQIEKDLEGGRSDEIESNLTFIKEAGQKLKQLLDGLMQITAIDRVESPPENIHYTELIATCLATLAGPLQQRGVNVTIDETALTLTGDRLQLGQIWQNLIENAIKYMGDQLHPHIVVGATPEGHDVVFYVRDNGIGIKPEHAERVFQLFTQLSKNNPGTGLGLSLVKKIVERYQGKVRVESAGIGKGSCFRFTLPGAVVSNRS